MAVRRSNAIEGDKRGVGEAKPVRRPRTLALSVDPSLNLGDPEPVVTVGTEVLRPRRYMNSRFSAIEARVPVDAAGGGRVAGRAGRCVPARIRSSNGIEPEGAIRSKRFSMGEASAAGRGQSFVEPTACEG